MNVILGQPAVSYIVQKPVSTPKETSRYFPEPIDPPEFVIPPETPNPPAPFSHIRTFSLDHTKVKYTYDILLSDTSDRNSPRQAAGETIQLTDNYFFLLTNDPTLISVKWYLDSQLQTTDTVSPYDFQGGTESLANDWDVTSIPDGNYTIEARRDDGITVLDSVTITVDNPAIPPDQPTEVNVLNSKITASADDGNIPSNVNDEDDNTRWSAEGTGQYLQIEYADAGQTVDIGSVNIKFFNGDQRLTFFEIWHSLDGNTWTVLGDYVSAQNLNNQNFNFEDVSTRFIRYYGKGNSNNQWNSLLRFRAVTPPDDPAPPSKPTVQVLAGDQQVSLNYAPTPGPKTDTWAAKRSTQQTSGYSQIASGLDPDNTHVDDGLTNNQQYFYKVDGTNTDGTSPESDPVSATPPGNNQISAFHSQSELDWWRSVVNQGPSHPNWNVSGGEYGWQKIVSLRNNFSNNNYIYPGPSQTPVRRSSEHNPPQQFHTLGDGMLCAAIHAAITDDEQMKNRVIDRALIQASQPDLDWSNRNKYILNEYNDSHPNFSQAEIWVSIFKAMSIVGGWSENRLTNSEKSLFEDRILRGMGEVGFNDNGGNYDTLLNNQPLGQQSPISKTSCQDEPYDNSNDCVRGYMYHFNNRRNNIVSFFGMAGSHLGVQSWVNMAKRMFKQWLQFNFHPDGWTGDFERGTNTTADLGWQYTCVELGRILVFVDYLARKGDFELYNYSTEHGSSSHGTASPGNPKTFEDVARAFTRYIQGDPQFYNRRRNGNLIDPDQIRPADVFFTQPNAYWKNQSISDSYYRRGNRSSLPSNPTSQGKGEWSRGPGGNHGDSIFIARGMWEAGVNPYA